MTKKSRDRRKRLREVISYWKRTIPIKLKGVTHFIEPTEFKQFLKDNEGCHVLTEEEIKEMWEITLS